MTWTESGNTYTTAAEGLEFVLEPTDWSIWDLDQAKASARHLANLRACGANSWAPGVVVRLSYRTPGEAQKVQSGKGPNLSPAKLPSR